MKKQCRQCNEWYPSGRHFNRDIQKSDGLTSYCKTCLRKKKIDFYEKNREKSLLYSKSHYQKNKEGRIVRQRLARKKVVESIFTSLGDKCSLCGFTNKVALQIDHKDGGGYKHRKVRGGAVMAYYKDITNHLTQFRLLCANCNLIEGVRMGYRKTIWN